MTTVEDCIIILDRLSTIINVIQYRVFCYEFCLSYVGSSGDEAQSMALIILECAKNSKFIQMSYREASSRQLITTSPDTVYLKMMTHATLFTDDFRSWPFVMPWVFFNDLMAQLREATQKEGYVLPIPIGLLTKSKQINSMTICRDLSQVSYKTILDMGEQIKSFLGHGYGGSTAALQHFHMDDGTEEDEDNNENRGGDCEEVHSANSRRKSCAEQIMEQGVGTVYRLPNLSSLFIAKTFERGGGVNSQVTLTILSDSQN